MRGTGCEPCEYITGQAARRRCVIEEEHNRKVRARAVKTAERIQISSEETRLKHEEVTLSQTGELFLALLSLLHPKQLTP